MDNEHLLLFIIHGINKYLWSISNNSIVEKNNSQCTCSWLYKFSQCNVQCYNCIVLYCESQCNAAHITSYLIVLSLKHYNQCQTAQTSFSQLIPMFWASQSSSSYICFLVIQWNIQSKMSQTGVFLTSTFSKSDQPSFFEVKAYTVSSSKRSDSIFMKYLQYMFRCRQNKAWLK